MTGEKYVMLSAKYDVYGEELSILSTLQCNTPVRNSGRLVLLTCNNPITGEEISLNVIHDASGFYTTVEGEKKYLIIDNNDGPITSMRTIQVAGKDGNTFYVPDNAHNFAVCVASLDTSGKLQLTPVTRQLVSSLQRNTQNKYPMFDIL